MPPSATPPYLTPSGEREELLSAIQRGDLEEIIFFLRRGRMDPTLRDRIGMTPLHLALHHGLGPVAEVVDLLIQKGADVNATDNEGNSVLSSAVEGMRDRSFIKTLIDSGADWNRRGWEGNSLLHSASFAGNVDALEFLLSLDGLTPDLKNLNGDTPLHTCVAYGKQNLVEVIQLLTGAGGDVNSENRDGYPVLARAVMKMRGQEVLSSLVELGAEIEQREKSLLHFAAVFHNLDAACYLIQTVNMNLNAKDNFGWTPLHCAVLRKNEHALNMVQLLVNYGADINAKDEDGDTVLALAVRGMQDETFLKELLALGANPQEPSTLLHIAAQIGNLDALKFLLGLDETTPELQDDDGYTLLRTVVLFGKGERLEMVRLLLAHGADLNAVDDDKLPVFASAALEKENDPEFLKGLIELGADWKKPGRGNTSVLHFAVASGNHEIIKFLLGLEGLTPNTKDDFGQTPLHTVVLYGDGPDKVLGTVQLLVQHGADINARTDEERSVLGYAIEGMRDQKFIKNLIGLGADWKSQGDNNSSLIHTAAEFGNCEALDFLLELEGMKIDLVDGNGWTPLHYSVRFGMKNVLETVNWLVGQGADINAKDSGGWSVLCHSVRSKQDLSILDRLIDLGVELENWVGEGGENMIHFCVKFGTPDILEFFLEEMRLDPNPTDDHGCTPLHHIAVLHLRLENVEEKVRILLEHGADKTILNEFGNTAYDFLIQLGYVRATKELKKLLKCPSSIPNWFRNRIMKWFYKDGIVPYPFNRFL